MFIYVLIDRAPLRICTLYFTTFLSIFIFLDIFADFLSKFYYIYLLLIQQQVPFPLCSVVKVCIFTNFLVGGIYYSKILSDINFDYIYLAFIIIVDYNFMRSVSIVFQVLSKKDSFMMVKSYLLTLHFLAGVPSTFSLPVY